MRAEAEGRCDLLQHADALRDPDRSRHADVDAACVTPDVRCTSCTSVDIEQHRWVMPALACSKLLAPPSRVPRELRRGLVACHSGT